MIKAPFSKEINRIMIRYWLYKCFTWQTQQFLCTSKSLKGPKTKKTKKSKKQTQQLLCSSHVKKETEDMRKQKTKAKVKTTTIRLISPPVPQPTPWYKSTSWFLIIYQNNTVDILVQSNKFWSVRNDEILILHLWFGTDLWVSIP